MISITRETTLVHRQLLLIPPLESISLLSRRPTSTLLPIVNPPPKFIDQTNQIITFANTHQPSTTPSSKFFFNRQNRFYGYLFSQLKSPSHLFEARRLHALLVVNGFFHPTGTDSVLGSQLVNIYVNFGRLQEARLVFDKLLKRSNIAWNAMLRGFIDVGQFPEAIEFYHLMLSQGVIPDNFTYPLVLKACSGLNDLEKGRSVRDTILLDEILHNVKRNIFVECAMIDMFAKCGSLSEAWQVFEEMPRKDLACWSAMIRGTVQNGEWFEAFCLFKRMRLEGIQPDSVIVATILPACGRLEARNMGMALQGCAIKSGFENDLFVSNALMDMYCKCGGTQDAHFIFCNMMDRDAVSWSTLIAGYSQNCQYRESFKLYLETKKEGIRTNAVISASVLPALARLKLLKQGKEMHNHILKQGFESDVVVGSALIDMYTNCGSVREAEYIFEIMSNTDITIWNSMIAGYSLNGDTDSGFGTFRRIWDSNLRPNPITLVSILPLCTKMGASRQGQEIHGYATRSWLGTVVSVGNSLIDTYCKCGHLELGVKVFNQMLEKNIVTFNSIISAHGIHGCGEEAFAFFEQMKEARIRPNKVTFIALLSACSHSGLVDRGCLLYNCMINDYNILPDMEHYSCLVDLLGRAGHLEDACNIIRRMLVEPDINVLGSLLGACRIHNRVDLGDFVGKHILQKNLKDAGYYVLLSNIYASTERWNDMLKVRTMIKEKSLIKKPGRSWIQIGCCIHVFDSKGRTHSAFNEIQEILEILLSEMEDKGYMVDPSFLSHDLVGDAYELINFDAG